MADELDLAPIPWPDTFEVTIAVSRAHEPLLIDWPDYIADWVEDGPRVEDCRIEQAPTDPGVYRCLVDWRYAGEDEPSFPITSWRKICDVTGSVPT